MKKTPLTALMAVMTIFLSQPSVSYAQFRKPEEKAARSLEKATEAFIELTTMGEDQSIPKKLLDQAEGIVVFPGALKVALGLGGQGGSGFAIIRKEDGSWSNPYFLDMGEASAGAQIGVQSTELILLFKKRRNVLDLENADLTLGGNVGVAVGPVGRSTSATTDIEFDAEIYSYSRSKGLYAGISLEGTVLKANKKVNEAVYGKDGISIKTIFYDLPTPFNSDINNFLSAVKKSSSK